MKRSRLLLLPFLLFVFAISGCDNDTSSNAQDIMEEPEELTCPCFTQDDIVNAFNGMALVQCKVVSVSVSLGGVSADPDFEVACAASISDFTCTNLGSTQAVDDLVATSCLLDIMNSTLQLRAVQVVTLACDFDVP